MLSGAHKPTSEQISVTGRAHASGPERGKDFVRAGAAEKVAAAPLVAKGYAI